MNIDEAKKAVDSEGFKVVDVRDGTQFERSHIANAVHVPLFVVNEDTDIGERHASAVRMTLAHDALGSGIRFWDRY